MPKASAQIAKLNRMAQQQHPGHNHLPVAGQPYPNDRIAHQIMFASADGIGIWVEVEYLDEDGQVQKRQLGKGIWPIKTTQINGFRSVQHTDQPITAETTGSGFQISVLM